MPQCTCKSGRIPVLNVKIRDHLACPFCVCVWLAGQPAWSNYLCEVQEIALLIETPATNDHSNEGFPHLGFNGAHVSLGIPAYR